MNLLERGICTLDAWQQRHRQEIPAYCRVPNSSEAGALLNWLPWTGVVLSSVACAEAGAAVRMTPSSPSAVALSASLRRERRSPGRLMPPP